MLARGERAPNLEHLEEQPERYRSEFFLADGIRHHGIIRPSDWHDQDVLAFPPLRHKALNGILSETPTLSGVERLATAPVCVRLHRRIIVHPRFPVTRKRIEQSRHEAW